MLSFVSAGFPGSGHSTKKDLKRTPKGPSKLTQGPFLCYNYGRQQIDLLNKSGMMKQLYHCGLYQYQLIDKLVALSPANHKDYLRAESVSNDDCGLHFYNPKWYCLPWLQHGGCIVCFKQSHHNSWHCGKNTTAHSQNIVAQRSNLEMLFTNGHYSLKELTTMERTSWQTECTHGLNQRTYKAFYSKLYFQGLKKIKGPKRTLGTLVTASL